MVLFRASAGILGQKMLTMAATILLLQQMLILPNTGNCNKCDMPIESDYKRNKNYIYWTCNSCRTKTALRSNTVLANSNLKLERFVLVMYCFSDRNRTYKQIINKNVKLVCFFLTKWLSAIITLQRGPQIII